MQKAFCLDACWIGDIVAISTKEWSKETKQKVVISFMVIIAAAVFFALI
jgi:hypothetical protein